MPYRDLREHLQRLESAGKLRRIRKPVAIDWEVACLGRLVFQALPEEERFGLLFEQVKGFNIPVATGILGASRSVYALALETTPDGIHDRWLQALRHPIPPRLVPRAPVQEMVQRQGEADLSRIPIPTWTPGKDAGPTLTALVITRDPQTGIQNTATYRCQVRGRNRLTVNITPGRHGHVHYLAYAARGVPTPVALAIGAEPAAHLAAIGNLPYGVDEMTVAGGLKGEAIEVVRAITSDLLVPASAQFILEGEIPPQGTEQEPAFGEFAGYMGAGGPKPYALIRCITHRPDPIYYGILSQMPPSESTMIQGQANEAILHKTLVDDLGQEGVTDVAINQTHGGILGHGVIQMRPKYPGHGKEVGRLAAEYSTLKMVTVVDDDVDPRDRQQLDWALNARMDPQRDIAIIPNLSNRMDPSAGLQESVSKLIIDATAKVETLGLSLPSRPLMFRALESWAEAGLPPIDLPGGLKLLLDRHVEG